MNEKLEMSSEQFDVWCAKHALTLKEAAEVLGLGSYQATWQYSSKRTRVPGPVIKLMRYIDKYGILS